MASAAREPHPRSGVAVAAALALAVAAAATGWPAVASSATPPAEASAVCPQPSLAHAAVTAANAGRYAEALAWGQAAALRAPFAPAGWAAAGRAAERMELAAAPARELAAQRWFGRIGALLGVVLAAVGLAALGRALVRGRVGGALRWVLIGTALAWAATGGWLGWQRPGVVARPAPVTALPEPGAPELGRLDPGQVVALLEGREPGAGAAGEFRRLRAPGLTGWVPAGAVFDVNLLAGRCR